MIMPQEENSGADQGDFFKIDVNIINGWFLLTTICYFCELVKEQQYDGLSFEEKNSLDI
jgi:hypothetical protein